MIKKRIPLILLAGMLVSCGTPAYPGGASSAVPSGQWTAHGHGSSVASSSSSEEQKRVNVYFFDPAGQSYAYENILQGTAVKRPEDPEQEGFEFVGWFTRDGEKFDFASLVYADTSLYARFAQSVYFDGYREEYLPNYSPLKSQDTLREGDEDVTITLDSDQVSFNAALDAKMVRLSGAFAGLTPTSVTVDGGTVSILTEGTVREGEGRVALAKQATDADAFLTAELPVSPRHGAVDASTYRLHDNGTKLDFTVRLSGMKLRNDGNLSKDDYQAKVNSGELPCFSLSLPDRYAMEMAEIADDFASFRLRLTLPEAMNETVAKELRDSLAIRLAKEALTGEIGLDLRLDLFAIATRSEATMYRHDGGECRGYFTIKLLSCRVDDAFAGNIDRILADAANKNLIFTIPGLETTLTKLSVADDATLKGEFSVKTDKTGSGVGYVSLADIRLSGDETPIRIAKNLYDGSSALPETEAVDYVFDQNAEPVTGGGMGTVTQSAAQCYRTVKTSVEQSAFKGISSSQSDSGEADMIIHAATGIGMIGYGLYSGDFVTAKSGASKLFGIDSLADPTTRILGALDAIADILLDIEKKIDDIADKIQVIQAELEKLGQQSLLTNYLSAHASWKAFVTDYFTPLENAIVAYSNDYFRHYHDLVIDSYDPYPGTEPTVELNYDRDGNLVFPGRNRALSIDGKVIDKAARKVVTLPTLHHALSGIFANDGHVYATIEDDVIADLFAEGSYDEKTVADIAKTIRYEAMRNHFRDDSDLDGFTATFSNFCHAFTGTEFGSNLKSSITPLDCYRIMLETVYNFGFEIEPEFNLTVVKIESVYYCARSFLRFTQFINSGEILSTRYDELDKAAEAEFTDSRFYHGNVDDKTIYSYAAGSYVAYSCNAFGMAFEIDEDQDVDAYLTRNEYFDCDYHEKLPDLSSIDEASVRLMALKVKLYNSLKGTSLGFKDYLGHIGIIPEDKLEKTLGVILAQKGLEDDDDEIEDMKFPSNWAIDVDRGETYAFKGKAFSFADDDTVNGLVCVTWDFVEHGMGDYYVPGNFTNVGYIDSLDGAHLGVWAYYVNFAPVSV